MSTVKNYVRTVKVANPQAPWMLQVRRDCEAAYKGDLPLTASGRPMSRENYDSYIADGGEPIPVMEQVIKEENEILRANCPKYTPDLGVERLARAYRNGQYVYQVTGRYVTELVLTTPEILPEMVGDYVESTIKWSLERVLNVAAASNVSVTELYEAWDTAGTVEYSNYKMYITL